MAMKSSKATQVRQGFVSRSSHPKVLRLRWGRIQERVVKNPYVPLPRARSPLKPKVTYYEFLGEEWSLQTSCAAHNRGRAITSTPSRLGAQGSKSNKLESAGLTNTSAQEMGMRLTSTNSCFCLLLTQIPQRNHSRMKRGERESSLLALGGVQLEGMARESELKEGREYLYPLIQK